MSRRSLAVSGLKLLLCVSQKFPALLSTSFEQLTALLSDARNTHGGNGGSAQLSDLALAILANCSARVERAPQLAAKGAMGRGAKGANVGSASPSLS
jgi:hypothetical protein